MAQMNARLGAFRHPKSKIQNLKFVLCLVLLALAGCSGKDGAAAAKGTGPTVQLVFDYDDGAEKRIAVPWQEGQTVLDAMVQATVHPRGIAFEQRGEGKNAMIVRIDDLANQQAGGEGKNWIYRVNGKLADRGCGEWTLRPGDVVLWRFTLYNSQEADSTGDSLPKSQRY
jgi:hypothetical protein